MKILLILTVISLYVLEISEGSRKHHKVKHNHNRHPQRHTRFFSDSENNSGSSCQGSSESVEEKPDCEESDGVDILILQYILDVCGPDTVLETCECGDNQLYWNDCVVNNTGKIKDGPAPRSCLSLTELNKHVMRKMEADKRKAEAKCCKA